MVDFQTYNLYLMLLTKNERDDIKKGKIANVKIPTYIRKNIRYPPRILKTRHWWN